MPGAVDFANYVNSHGGTMFYVSNRDSKGNYRSKFGTQFIVLPNPMYGNWEGALAPDYFRLNPKQQVQVRENALRAWSGNCGQ
ncbi:5'-nucleotidase [Salmonella enterica subsp. enterica serovar Gaminara str. ATCC BAA-711]|nr:5'-nucleotidase [Salmonella enterica subsp. enterica serovar Gaminara str. ATCC BAA-711]